MLGRPWLHLLSRVSQRLLLGYLVVDLAGMHADVEGAAARSLVSTMRTTALLFSHRGSLHTLHEPEDWGLASLSHVLMLEAKGEALGHR